MKLTFKKRIVFIFLLLNLSGCGSDTVDTPESIELPIPEQSIKIVQASTLAKIPFSYITSSANKEKQTATALIDLPDESKTIQGNIIFALDVIDTAGIEQISLDFSNGDDTIDALQVCGGDLSSCSNSAFNLNETDNTNYRLFLNGINPHDYLWQSGPNIINVWVDNIAGERSIAVTLSINWQAVVIESTQAEFINLIHDDSTGANTGDLSISWSTLPDYSFYNVFIATEPGVNSDSVTSSEGGQARLSLVDNNIIFEGIDADKEYYFTVSGVNDGGESAFSLEKNIVFYLDGAPRARDDVAQVIEGNEVIVNVVENDTDDLPDSLLNISQLTNGTNGEVIDNGDGSVTYLHDGSQTTSDQFTYSINDGEFESATAIVTIFITLENDIPIAQDDFANVNEGNVVIIDVRSNDTDEETLTRNLIISSIGEGLHGVVVNNNDGTVTYTHDGSETLTDSFTYTINDGELNSLPVTVSITINPINEPPIAVNDVSSVNEGESIIINLRINDYDEDSPNNELILTNISDATNGTIINNNDGTVTYNHNGTETVTDSFTYTISDGELSSNVATVMLTIRPVNDIPTAIDDVANVDEGSVVIIPIRINDFDNETLNTELNVTNLGAASNGAVVNNNDGTITYTHNGSETVSDTFSYTINDGEFDSIPAIVLITINPINDRPRARNDSATVNYGGNVTIDVLANDSDAETPNNELVISNVGSASNGTVFISGTDITYAHGGSGGATSDSFTYTISDGSRTDSATVFITIAGGGGSPISPISFSKLKSTYMMKEKLVIDDYFGINGESLFSQIKTNDAIVDSLIQTDGNVILVINIEELGAQKIASIRLNSEGLLDSSYGEHGIKTFEYPNEQQANHAVLDSSDNLYIVGTEVNSNAYPIVIKVDNQGVHDKSFSFDGKFEYIFDDSAEGKDMLIHSNGNIYLAVSGYNSTTFKSTLKLIRIDTNGNIINLNTDGGINEFELFSQHDFYTLGLDEILTGELVVFGTIYDAVIEESNFGVAVIDETNFYQPSLVSASFDIQQAVSGIGHSNDIAKHYLKGNQDSYFIAGTSNYLQDIEDETIMMKVNVTNSTITINNDFASSGVQHFTSTTIKDLALDNNENIYAVGHKTNEPDDNIILKISSMGNTHISLNSRRTSDNLSCGLDASESFYEISFDGINNRIIVGLSSQGSLEHCYGGVRVFNLLNNDSL